MTSSNGQMLRDQSLEFLRSGYLFASRIRQRAGVPSVSQVPVRLRLMGRPALLIRGTEAVRDFYDSEKFSREGAMPAFIRLPLFGGGAVHGLDGHAHAVRKNALADMAYDDDRVAGFAEIVAEELETMSAGWERRGTGTELHRTRLRGTRAPVGSIRAGRRAGGRAPRTPSATACPA
ncbi:hypothetical protein [Dietzia sp. PP-33]|uniref:hypothetical protein n=1 Tax=Dietzia sp. PP-33 TaxID=2957500 RepID=UPI0029B156F8|nr:hypothetical protein [Dietzia sp. PP-33]MDX2358154.1 hypothetical protein [Dietzia sp. PP-33]